MYGDVPGLILGLPVEVLWECTRANEGYKDQVGTALVANSEAVELSNGPGVAVELTPSMLKGPVPLPSGRLLEEAGKPVRSGPIPVPLELPVGYWVRLVPSNDGVAAASVEMSDWSK